VRRRGQRLRMAPTMSGISSYENNRTPCAKSKLYPGILT
jgi:hypothetical protein